jgi:hypothetical protein
MKTAFIITSAINTAAGIYPPEIRILQTQETITSIRKFFPDALTVLVEGSSQRLSTTPTQGFQQLRDRVNVFIDMTGNEQIAHLHSSIIDTSTNRTEMGGMTGMAKTIAELTLLGNTLDTLCEHPDMQPLRDVDRIFKISGRYIMSPMFKPEEHDQPGKWVFRQRDPSWIANAQQSVGTDYFYASRLWSFDARLLQSARDKYRAMIADAHDIAERGAYVDIEHLLYKHIGPEASIELKNTHCMGTIAPNGMMIYD